MKITQWFIFVVTFMLIMINLRMIGEPLLCDSSMWALLEKESFADNELASLNDISLHEPITLARRMKRSEIWDQDQEPLSESVQLVQPVQLVQAKRDEFELPSQEQIVSLFWDMLRDRIHSKKKADNYHFRVGRLKERPGSIDRKGILQYLANELVSYENAHEKTAKPQSVEVEQENEQIVLNEPEEVLVGQQKEVKLVIVDDKKNELQELRDLILELKEARQPLDEKTVLGIAQPSAQMPQPQYIQPNAVWGQQPTYYQQQMQPQLMVQPQMMPVNNAAQMAAMAMQLQSSAMAMQQQASALMMQAQQPQQIMPQAPMYGMPVQMPMQAVPQMPIQSALNIPSKPVTNKDKINHLMRYFQQMVDSNHHDMQRLLALLDQEFDIIELLMNGGAGSIVERSVRERNSAIKQSNPLIVAAYNLIVDLASNCKDDTDVRLYRHYVRKGRKPSSIPAPGGKKRFLINMLSSLEHYYDMIENMQGALTTIS